MSKRKCRWCDGDFVPVHGNNTYCPDHEYDAKKERQKQERDPIKHLLILAKNNHKGLDAMFRDGELQPNTDTFGYYKVDISFCRYLQPPPEHAGKRMLDFGQYFLIKDPHLETFKLFIHEE